MSDPGERKNFIYGPEPMKADMEEISKPNIIPAMVDILAMKKTL